MIERIKIWLRLFNELFDSLFYLALFVFIIYPAMWIVDKLRPSGE